VDNSTVTDRFEATFWGARGTLPFAGENTIKYGGNTSCLGIDIGSDRHFIFDAGTGLRCYSRHLMQTAGGKFSGYIFISQPHWDHLNCLPFFTPVFIPGNRITLMGPGEGGRSFRDLIDAQMDGTYFPITVDAFQADVTYRDMEVGVHQFDGVAISAFDIKNSGICFGYRVDYAGHSLAYITHNDLGDCKVDDGFIRELCDFIKAADFLIHDATYFDHEHRPEISRWHSNVAEVVSLAHRSQVKKLFLFHHDPEHEDEQLETMLAEARDLIAQSGATCECFIATEGETWDVIGGVRVA
jgi:phosphoribosyl 1,2-cyclic phosphodiesterase